MLSHLKPTICSFSVLLHFSPVYPLCLDNQEVDLGCLFRRDPDGTVHIHLLMHYFLLKIHFCKLWVVIGGPLLFSTNMMFSEVKGFHILLDDLMLSETEWRMDRRT